ncbi:MAG: DUF484 family protein [Halothiobacillus sp.]|jgi:uncharacterized protein YigA (DUF484 family)|nr:DUF484 family protein [Halothiobacillus sp.]
MTEATAVTRLPETPQPPLDPKQVTAFLNEHPNFLPQQVASQLRATLEHVLAENPDLVAELELPHPPVGVTSLPHVQLRLWRERLARLEHKITQLHVAAENNARLDQIMHDLAFDLIGTEHRSPERLCAIIHNHFTIDMIRVLPLSELSADQMASLQGWLSSESPLCGRLNDAQRRTLFDADFPETGSAALIVLKPRPETGLILALGRFAPDGFNPSQGTLFLKQIGELAAAFLREPVRS